MVTATPELLGAYLAALYRVRLDGGEMALRIGQPAPPVLAHALPAASWTLVTAWNPQSVPRDEASNHAAGAALEAELHARGLAVLPAEAGDADDGWHEPGLLVADVPAREADAIARRYGQAGLLHWRMGQPVRLRMYRPRPPGDRTPHVDWP
ncbi:DUF3293 domain-containing protein [Pseudoxanthomonas broegbernensis]|nr:DUF3293 domain-containing protein [Pseudoxanthomonas broegbernensis]MBB6064594.1 hypothetical protein [Pseudoxanthomonas broegbernensis]